MWHSFNGGASWDVYSADAPQALLAMHLSIAPGNKLRVASYGLGVWQTDLAVASKTQNPVVSLIQGLSPNPASSNATLEFTLTKPEKTSLKLVDLQGKTVWKSAPENLPAGNHSRQIPVSNLPAGHYAVVLETNHGRSSRMLAID